MSNIAKSLRLPIIISSTLLIPFIILELVNRRTFHEDFPFPLFGLMWLLSVIFIFILAPLTRRLWAGKGIMLNPMGVLLRVALLIPIAWMWIGLLVDQMPCFLGVPNCD